MSGSSAPSSFDTDLCGCAILEKDVNGEVLLVWNYPKLEEHMENVLIKRSQLEADTVVGSSFSRFGSQWIYIRTLSANDTGDSAPTSSSLAHVEVFSICLLSKVFNPEKYLAMATVLGATYSTSASPPAVLAAYLDVFRKGVHGSFDSANFDPRRALLVTSPKDVTRMFGPEIVLVWNAILLKKRVVVHCENLSALLKVIRAFPAFAWHRRDWDILRPFVVAGHAPEIADLSSGVYVAGMTDPRSVRALQLYDVFVNIDQRSITVADHAKESFRMTSFHKDMATFLVQNAEDPNVDVQTFIKGMAMKTQQLLGKIQQLRVEVDGKLVVTRESIEAHKLPANMPRFLYDVAVAEQLT
mmetsp:Transcript_23686/g.59283  ORF Transcript_23686/g.59283 Transcript_23686/m.59283 type:complete len:356 (-) Transcript_23686:60-1127(-)|eukprot:CAMPEP_0174229642 /NCGR_PEP_ID=MMETSP0417-20130205/537_1 /TAXON_ID=242541 /ORGANISM="Mayorella sp, Strain BSH-02190019" /LENGTH=355 /DNA_ID=CAMNT_0015307205 /DNA_START=75 /DNA_END=1142 /DNA_ORIENTATION=-